MPPAGLVLKHNKDPLSTYYKALKTNRQVSVTCKFCPRFESAMTLQTFREDHARDVHHRDPKLECVYCGGAFKWPVGKKCTREVSLHLLRCMKEYLNEHGCVKKKFCLKVLPQPPSEDVAVDPTTTTTAAASEPSLTLDLGVEWIVPPNEPRRMCECAEFNSDELAFNMSFRTRFTEYPEFYQPLVNEKPVDFWYRPNLGDVAFQRACGLGSEASGMIRMMQSPGTRRRRWTFYHVFLRPCAIRKFNEVMGGRNLLNHVAVSPFGCLCDGQAAFEGNEGGRHHRHVILATDLNREFSRVCQRVRCGERNTLHRHACCMRKYKVVNTPHLMSAIRYVSMPNSNCGKRRLNLIRDPCVLEGGGIGSLYDHHYFIARPMHPHVIVAMSALYPGGLEWLVTKHNSGKKISGWKYREERQPNGKWRYSVRLGDTGIDMKDCVLRWSKELEPASDREYEDEVDLVEPPYIPAETSGAAADDDDDEGQCEGSEMDGEDCYYDGEMDGEISTAEEDNGKPFRCYLIGTSMILRSNPVLRGWNDQDWILHQAERGNRFLHCVEDVDWKFSKQQAKTANQIREVKERMVLDKLEELDRMQELFRQEVREEREKVSKLQEEMKAHLLEQIRNRDDEIRKLSEEIRNRDDLIKILFLQHLEQLRKKEEELSRGTGNV